MVNTVLGVLLHPPLKSPRQHLYFLATLAQQAELYALTRLVLQPRAKPPYLHHQHVFGAAQDLGMLMETSRFLTSNGEKIKNGSYVQI